MESNTDLQNSAQCLAQNQAQTNPPSSDSSSAAIISTPLPPPAGDTLDREAKARKKRRDMELRALSKTFGHIPNVPIFTQWEKRQDCSDSAVHRSVMAGICGNAKDGAYSVVLSKAYKDNEDWGDVMYELFQDADLYLTVRSIYTGAGGRERWTQTFPPKRLRCGPQTMDQSWEHDPNKALKLSLLTKSPVRVIRSWRCGSQYAPPSGYRYDGLYEVAACWMAKGHNGKKICRCRLERLPDQPPIPARPITISAGRRRRERLVSNLDLSSSPSVSSNQYDISDETDIAMSPNQPDASPGKLASARGVPEGLQNPPQQRAMSESSTEFDFNMGELDPDVKYPLPLAPQSEVSPKPSASRTRYRWDPRNNALVRIPVPDAIVESDGAAGGDEEENRVEGDDATLVPESEDDPVDVPVNERMGTEYFSDIGEPHTSGSPFSEN